MMATLVSLMPMIAYNASNATLLFSDVAMTNCTREPATMDTFTIFKVVIDVFLVGFLCLVGFVGNALSIAVLDQDSDRNNTTNWLLRTLAVVDTMYLVASVFIQLVKTLHDHTDWVPELDTAFVYMEPYVWAFASSVQTTTVWTVMLVTIDRYVAVCKPFQVQLRSLQRAKMAFMGIVVAAIVYNIPRLFEREILVTANPCGGDVISTKKTALASSWIYFLVYKTILYFMFRAFGPLLTLIVLNTLLMRALHAVRKRREKLTRNIQHRENMTLVLVIVVTVFFVCQIPDLTLRIIMTFVKLHVIDLDLAPLRYVNAVTNMLLTINSSTNFLVYCLIGKKFRKLLGQMCCAGENKANGRFQMEVTHHNSSAKTVRAATAQTNGKAGPSPAHV